MKFKNALKFMLVLLVMVSMACGAAVFAQESGDSTGEMSAEDQARESVPDEEKAEPEQNVADDGSSEVKDGTILIYLVASEDDVNGTAFKRFEFDFTDKEGKWKCNIAFVKTIMDFDYECDTELGGKLFSSKWNKPRSHVLKVEGIPEGEKNLNILFSFEAYPESYMYELNTSVEIPGTGRTSIMVNETTAAPSVTIETPEEKKGPVSATNIERTVVHEPVYDQFPVMPLFTKPAYAGAGKPSLKTASDHPGGDLLVPKPSYESKGGENPFLLYNLEGADAKSYYSRLPDVPFTFLISSQINRNNIEGLQTVTGMENVPGCFDLSECLVFLFFDADKLACGSFTTLESNVLRSFKIRNPAHDIMGAVTGYRTVSALYVTGSYMYAGYSDSSLRVLKIADKIDYSDMLKNISQVGDITALKGIIDIEIDGATGFFLDSGAVNVVDLSSPAKPSIKKSVKLKNVETGMMKKKDNLLFVSTYYTANKIDGISILDVSNPVSPSIKGAYNLPSGYRITDFVVSEKYIVLGRTRGATAKGATAEEISIINITDPAAPKLEGSYKMSGAVTDIQATDNELDVCLDNTSIQVFDLK